MLTYSIGEVARLTGVSQRMLRHYDEIGLLVPSDRTVAGYREYSEADLLRLQRILSYRALGLGLAETRDLVDAPPADVVEQLRAQEGLLRAAIERMQAQLARVEKTRELKAMGIDLEPEDMFEVFGDHDPTAYADEVRERWGETDAYAESRRRTSSYSKEDWQRVQAEGDDVVTAFVAAMAAGLPSDSDEAKAAAELHRLQIDRNFYACSYEMQTGLAAMYLADERFTQYYDDRAPGLAQYVHDAIYANALDHM